MGAALFFSTLSFLIGGGVAHAHPSFAVVEQHARAGDTVHFSIAGAKSRVDYEIEVHDREVLEGSAAGNLITGEFTMPALGEDARTVKIEAELRQSGKKTKSKPKIEYLGLALPATEAAPAEGPPVPVALPNAVLAPASTPAAATPPSPAAVTPKASGTPASPARAVRRGRSETGRKSAKRNRVERRGRVERQGRKAAHRKQARRGKRSRRPPARTAPLFDGVPEPGSGGFRASDGDGFAAINAIVPPTTVADAAATRAAGAALPLAVLVPGLLGLAALTLTATALHRRRALRRR